MSRITPERLKRKAHVYREMVKLLEFSIWMWERSADWDDAQEVMQKITAEAVALEEDANRLERETPT